MPNLIKEAPNLVRMAIAAGMIGLRIDARRKRRPNRYKYTRGLSLAELKKRARESSRATYHANAAEYRAKGLTTMGTKPKNKRRPELAHLKTKTREYHTAYMRIKRAEKGTQTQ